MIFFNQPIECPIGNGGGICKYVEDVEKLVKTDISVIEIGSITEDARFGNEGNVFHDGGIMTLNSLGLPNPGSKYYRKYLRQMTEFIHKAGKTAIVNVVGFTIHEYSRLTRLAFNSGADVVVLNLGCPNVFVGEIQKDILTYDLPGLQTTTIQVLSENLREARQGRIGLKLSPIENPGYIVKVAGFLNRLCQIQVQQSFGFVGFISTQNTNPNCYDENEAGIPYINPNGGLAGGAGPVVFPQALGQVKQFRKILDEKIKIIGIGGIKSGLDVEKMIRNGASFCQMASPYFQKNEDVGVFNTVGAEYLEIQAKKCQ